MDSKPAADFVHHPGEADAVHAAPPQPLGARLHAARQAAGMTLAEVSAQTRVPERMLASIEAGAYEALPHPTFTGGFVRSFAREVGVNEAEAAAQYRAENTRIVAAPAPVSMRVMEPQRVPSRQLAWASAAVAALAVVGGGIYFATRDRAPAPAPVAATTAPALLTTAPTPSGPSAATPGATPPGAAVPNAPAAPLPVAGAVTLTATQDTWIQVRERTTHARVMSGVLAQGQTYAVPPGDYTLSTGRAGALQVKVGGRLLPPLGGPVDVLHEIGLDAASLAARTGSPPTAPMAGATLAPTPVQAPVG